MQSINEAAVRVISMLYGDGYHIREADDYEIPSLDVSNKYDPNRQKKVVGIRLNDKRQRPAPKSKSLERMLRRKKRK